LSEIEWAVQWSAATRWSKGTACLLVVALSGFVFIQFPSFYFWPPDGLIQFPSLRFVVILASFKRPHSISFVSSACRTRRISKTLRSAGTLARF